MEWNTLFQLIHSCTDCNTSLITGIEQLSAHFQEHIFFQSRQSVDCTLFFQQILEDKKPGELCCITDSYHIYTCVVLLPKETFIILGPYLLEKPSHTFINKISTKNKIPISMLPSLRHFYNQMPLLITYEFSLFLRLSFPLPDSLTSLSLLSMIWSKKKQLVKIVFKFRKNF